MCAVRDCRPGTERSSYGDNLADLLIRSTRLSSLVRVDLDTVGTLSRQSNSDRHQFLIFRGDCTGGHGRLIEGPECLESIWSVGLDDLELAQILHVVQVTPPDSLPTAFSRCVTVHEEPNRPKISTSLARTTITSNQSMRANSRPHPMAGRIRKRSPKAASLSTRPEARSNSCCAETPDYSEFLPAYR